ncbi:MAG: tolB protein precursor [Deltaproteobacteria bacterium]|nr:tolB protein precursor [Deltaproteobacteria bacterium]
MRFVALVVAATIAACAGDEGRLELSPANLTVTIIDGEPVVQAYEATLIGSDGSHRDVTDEARFVLDDPLYGAFSEATLEVSGRGAGPVRVSAATAGAIGDTTLSVVVQATVLAPEVSPEMPALFEAAVEDPARAPQIAYPADGVLVPPNLGQLDVHWIASPNAATDDLFQVSIVSPYLDLRVFTKGLDPVDPAIKFWTMIPPALWTTIASTRQRVKLAVTGTSAAAPATKGTSEIRQLDVANENARGGVYYWSITRLAADTGIYRYDIGRPDVPPAPLFPAGTSPSPCMGCHALSRDGTKIAMTLDNPDMRATVLEVGNRGQLIRYDQTVQERWNFATFSADGAKLVTVFQGAMSLRSTYGGAILADLENSPGTVATHPELAPDNSRLVSVEATGMPGTIGGLFDLFSNQGSLVVRTFDDATNTFGPITMLVPADAAQLQANFYPSFSPDGEWIVFTRTTGAAYSDPSAQTWVVKADGSMPPIQLAAANLTGNLTSSWARWVPFAQTFGPALEPMYYLSFSSMRPFGVRLPALASPQIWMAPFFPERARAGLDPSGPAFRLPFQEVTAGNHVAQWTEAVVTTSGGSSW